MPKGSDNPFPSVLVVEGTTPASPSAGNQRIFIDSADSILKTVDSGGTVSTYLTSAGSSVVVQVVNTQTGAVATGTTTIPFDDSIPQNTEGTEFMTLAITPTDAANKLRIEVEFVCTNSASVFQILALFQDTTANALAADWSWWSTGTAGETLRLTHYMTAGTTSATTFKVRSGGNVAGTTTFNGQSGGRILGGVSASSITITELTP